jgi:hypothetical protein
MKIISIECPNGRDAVDTARDAAHETASVLGGEIHLHEVWESRVKECALLITSAPLTHDYATKIVVEHYARCFGLLFKPSKD